jgi:hypothetical protein
LFAYLWFKAKYKTLRRGVACIEDYDLRGRYRDESLEGSKDLIVSSVVRNLV